MLEPSIQRYAILYAYQGDMIGARVMGARTSDSGGDAATDFIQITATRIATKRQRGRSNRSSHPSSLPTFLCGSFWAAAVSSQSSATATTFVCLLSSFCKHADQMGKIAVLIRQQQKICAFAMILCLGQRKAKCGLCVSRLLIRQHKYTIRYFRHDHLVS